MKKARFGSRGSLSLTQPGLVSRGRAFRGKRKKSSNPAGVVHSQMTFAQSSRVPLSAAPRHNLGSSDNKTTSAPANWNRARESIKVTKQSSAKNSRSTPVIDYNFEHLQRNSSKTTSHEVNQDPNYGSSAKR